mgnify:CR=1 FL=1
MRRKRKFDWMKVLNEGREDLHVFALVVSQMLCDWDHFNVMYLLGIFLTV